MRIETAQYYKKGNEKLTETVRPSQYTILIR